MEPEGSLPCSQGPTTGPCPEPPASSPHSPILSSPGCLAVGEEQGAKQNIWTPDWRKLHSEELRNLYT